METIIIGNKSAKPWSREHCQPFNKTLSLCVCVYVCVKLLEIHVVADLENK